MKYEHAVIRDLMPLCIDGIASPESEQAVRNHIAECAECAAEWELMQTGSIPQPSAALPEDTAGYTEAAKRVRKHRRRNRLLTCGAGLLVIGGLYARGLYTSGAHFSMRRVMADFVRQDIAEQIYSEEHNQTGSIRNFPQPEYTYLGEIHSEDKLAACAYAFVKHPEQELYSFTECHGNRFDRFHFHLMYELSGGGWSFLPKKTGIYMSDGGFSEKNENSITGIRSLAFYVTDPQVRTITVKDGTEERSLTPDENGFCCMLKHADSETADGKASDENGTVLYTIQEVTYTTQYGEEYFSYDWLPAE